MKNDEIDEKTAAATRFDDATTAYSDWMNSDDEIAPPRFWAAALDVCAAVAKNDAEPRFLHARDAFAAFFAACRPFLTRNRGGAALIDSRRASTDSAIWGAWREICAALDAFDSARRRAAEKTPRSTRSLDELRKLGVSTRQICRILGFWNDDDAGGYPDLERLARAENGDVSAFDEPSTASASTANYSESTAADPSFPPPGTDNENVREEFTDSLDLFILEGLPPRQIAARLGLDVDAVRRRFSELGVYQADGVISLTPRAQIAAKKWIEENPDGSYLDCAEAISTANKPVESEDVAAFFERLRENEGLVEIYSEIGGEENVMPSPETDAQNVEGKKRRKR